MNTVDLKINEEEVRNDATTIFGFWLYVMTDFVLFACLFAVYAVLRNNVAGGPGGHELFDGPYVLTETILLLTSSLTAGFALLGSRSGSMARTIVPLLLSLVLGASFLIMEICEFGGLIAEGATPMVSGFLSGYFTLVGTHGFHIFVGLLWGVALTLALLIQGITRSNLRKLALWTLFWHFLDIVWIFIFTIVYLTALL